MTNFDYIIVGTGLTGSVIARVLKDNNYSVLMIERRNHLGGNVHDFQHESGIRVHSYGPHYFRTSNSEVLSFLGRFSSFYPYEAKIKSRIGNNQYENWPISGKFIRKCAEGEWKPKHNLHPKNFEEAALNIMPEKVYNLLVKEYTEKQWGKPCTELNPSLMSRFRIHMDDDPRLTPEATFQGLPIDGYSQMMKNMVDGIPIVIQCDYLKLRNEFTPRNKLIFTGPVDEYFDFSLGKLEYRSQERKTKWLYQDYYQPCAQVNNPLHSFGGLIRTIEWKYLMWNFVDPSTVITHETPFSPTDPDQYEYPMPDEKNKKLYLKYREMADKENGVLICGRLGEYEYLDMDKAIERAFIHAKELIRAEKSHH